MYKLSNILILIGILIVVIGFLMKFTPAVKFIGKLPGDIRIEKENFRFYFPLTSLIILSIIVNIIIKIFKR